MTIHDPNWKTATAEESRKPGYLQRRFAAIKKQLKADADAAADDERKAEEAQKVLDAETAKVVTGFKARR